MSAVPTPQSGAVPGRARGFLSAAREIDDAAVGVQGALPSWLRRTLLLNGPALWELPRGRLEHRFDGYGMWHAIRIEDSNVRWADGGDLVLEIAIYDDDLVFAVRFQRSLQATAL